MKVLPALLAVLLLVLLAGCATSRGRLYEQVAAGSRKAEAEQEGEGESSVTVNQSQNPEENDRGLEILSTPDNAEVYVDNRFVGTTPLLLEDLQRGRYRLTIRKNGFYAYTAWVSYDAEYVRYEVTLDRITGFLSVTAVPEDAEILVGDTTLSSGTVAELPIGVYTVRVRAFGYQDYQSTARVRERSLTSLQVTLLEAPFELSGLRASRPVFNPRSPGLLGSTRISFRVTTYGSGEARISAADGRVVRRVPLPRFTTWRQSFIWQGRDQAGALLPDGAYTVSIDARGEGEESLQVAETTVRIDSSVRIGIRSLWSGSSGTLFAPVPEALPAASLQISTAVMAHAAQTADGLSILAPWNLGLRAGLGPKPANPLELDAQAGVVLGYAASNSDPLVAPFFASLALRSVLAKPAGISGAGGAVQAKLAYYGLDSDTMANFTGLSLGVPLMLRLGPVTLTGTPELMLSPWRVSYDPAQARVVSATLWGYGRAGLLVEAGPFTAGLSAAVRSTPFAGGLGLNLPFQAGAEAHLLLPGTQLYLSALVAGEFSGLDNLYLLGGAGLTLLD